MGRVFLITAAVAAGLAACAQEERPSAMELEYELIRAEMALAVQRRGYPCDRVIGSDANLIVCALGRHDVRIYRIRDTGDVERVRPGF